MKNLTICQNCGKEYFLTQKARRRLVFCSAKCQHKKQVAEGASNFKGGKFTSKDGRVMLLVGKNRYRAEHLIIAESIIGYEIKGGYVIHIDGNLSNNFPENLFLYSSNSEFSSDRQNGIIPSKSNLYPLTYRKISERGSCISTQKMSGLNFQRILPKEPVAPWTAARIKWKAKDLTMVKTRGTPGKSGSCLSIKVKP